MKKIPNEAMTHAGRFHADDVFATALLRIINPKIVIKRVNVLPDNYAGLAFDIAGGNFDHHGTNELVRTNGVPYASFGLLWRELGPELVGENAAHMFDATFVEPLDIQDNNGGNNQLARIITQANPKWDSDADPDESFFKVVKIAEFILNNEIDSMRSTDRAKKLVQEALLKQEDGIVVLKKGVPWKGILVPSSAKYVVYPSARGGFNAQAVPLDICSQVCKAPFPIEWRGRSCQELVKMTNISGFIFCHPGGYLLNTQTEYEAINACKVAMKWGNSNEKNNS